MSIKVYDSMSRKKKPLVPLTDNHVKIYACGITTNDHFHLGHALQAIYFDVIWRYLEWRDYKVTYVRNYTDVDDKIIVKAKEKGVSPLELSKSIIASSEEDMVTLGCRPPTHAPKVSESIPEIIKMIEEIIANGKAYATNEGDVYFSVRKKDNYGKLSGRNPDELRSGSRDLQTGDKEDPLDFALWKHDETPGVSWDSPWGAGRPGWHIECSAMSRMFLGETFDIHGGGLDLIFPHHENEIAQSEAAHNEAEYAKTWMHSGLLTIDKQKMSKSLGNQIVLKDFLKEYSADVLRMAFLEHHYRSSIDFKKDTFSNAERRLLCLFRAAASTEDFLKRASFDVESVPMNETYLTAFRKAVDDDFNTPAGLAVLNDIQKALNKSCKAKAKGNNLNDAASTLLALRHCLRSLGIDASDATSTALKLRDIAAQRLGIEESWVQSCIQKRNDARKNKDFSTADQVRDELKLKGVELLDCVDSTDWMLVESDS